MNERIKTAIAVHETNTTVLPAVTATTTFASKILTTPKTKPTQLLFCL